jgi:ribose transport system substrate-binding protein
MRTTQLRRLLVLGASAAASVAIAACGSSSSSSSSSSSASSGATTAGTSSTSSGASSTAGGTSKVGKKTIAYVEIYLPAPIDLRDNEIFKMAAAKVGWTVDTTDAGGNGQTADQNMQAAVNDHVNAIITDADPSLIESGLKAAKAAKIPVISIGGENTHGLDSLESGVYTESDGAMSQALGKELCSEVKPGSEIALLRFDLFYSGKIRGDTIDKMATACGLKVVAQPATQQTFASANSNMSAILQQYPNLAAVVPVYDTFMSGAVQAIKTAGKQNQVKVFGFYADSVDNPLMRANKNIVGVVDGTQGYGAPLAVTNLLAYFAHGTKIPHSQPKNLYSYKVITQSDIPPVGQDGPLPFSAYINKYLPIWQSKYGVK